MSTRSTHFGGSQVSRGTDSFIQETGRKRLKERVLTNLNFRSTTMNTLALIKKQINKAAALHNAQISHTAYRGVEYDVSCDQSSETHGTFCYRGRTYNK